MFQVARIHDGARSRIVTGHIVRIGVCLVAGDATHNRHMVKTLRNLFKPVRDQQHGTVRFLRADTAQRTQRDFTAAQIETGGRLVQNQ